jgi:hypothetical protein
MLKKAFEVMAEITEDQPHYNTSTIVRNLKEKGYVAYAYGNTHQYYLLFL